MSLRRGELVTVAAKGPYTSKPRPALVIQASETLPYLDSVTGLPLAARISISNASEHQYLALRGITFRTPPRGFGVSPL